MWVGWWRRSVGFARVHICCRWCHPVLETTTERRFFSSTFSFSLTSPFLFSREPQEPEMWTFLLFWGRRGRRRRRRYKGTNQKKSWKKKKEKKKGNHLEPIFLASSFSPWLTLQLWLGCAPSHSCSCQCLRISFFNVFEFQFWPPQICSLHHLFHHLLLLLQLLRWWVLDCLNRCMDFVQCVRTRYLRKFVEDEESLAGKEAKEGHELRLRTPSHSPFLPNIFFFINSALWAAYGAQTDDILLEVTLLFFCLIWWGTEKKKK